jgi:predicted DNA-binding transcriptional regulator YafY
MARGDQLGRQWKIIRTLIASKQGKSVQSLASELACHPRTVYRDLEALQVAGFPVYTERHNNKSYWSLLDSAKHAIPIPFSIMELMALYFSRDMLKILKDTHFHDSLESLFQKVKATLPSEYLDYLKKIESSLQVGVKPYKDYSQFRETIDIINTAIHQRRQIQMTYYAMSRKKISLRLVDPYKLWFFDATFYILAHCHSRKGVRLFAVERIKTLSQTDASFEPPSDFDIDSLLQDSFGAFIGDTVEVIIQFSAQIAGYIQERTWHQSQVLEHQPDGSLLFKVKVAGLQAVKSWILGWGQHALVLKPAELRQEILSETQATLKQYGVS